jgi:nucleotide-binding universal stress UspA family protein
MTVPPESADLLVVGSRGSDVHEGLLLGSTSLELAERSTIPVTIVPSASEGENFTPV